MAGEAWLTWGVPVVALAFGGLIYGIVWLSARDFDRRYPNSPK